MRKLLVLDIACLIGILLIGSCNLKKRCAEQYPCPESKVETVKTITQYDTITLPADSAIYKALIECRNGKPYVSSEWVDDGTGLSIFRLISPLHPKNDSIKQLVVRVQEKPKAVSIPQRVTEITSTAVKEARSYCPGISSWQWFQIWSGRLFWLLLLLYLAAKAIKNLFKINIPFV